MYCVNCGVKLADTEKQCPLCGIRAFHPDLTRQEGESLYPKDRYPANPKSSRVMQIIATALFLLPLLITLQCDLQINGAVTWSGYVAGALLMAYVVIVLPNWFRKPNPVIFVPIDFAAAGLYVLYINLATGGGWFLSFAFPIIGGVGLIVTAVVTLMRYVPKGALYTFGGAFMALGAFMILVEYLESVTFGVRIVGWCVYPLLALAVLGGILIYLAANRNARETMERKFFL